MMKIFESIAELRRHLELQRKKGSNIGLVPTMGALHQGHARLIRESVQACDLTVCSIFVNPTQFNNPDDLLKYPNQIDADQKLLEQEGCDVLFKPKTDEVYPGEDECLKISFGPMEEVLEGEFRPGHFSGVGVVVLKLLNMVRPERAYFGQKDLQQLAIIKKLVKDLNVPVDIISVPTVREPSGLAMSSRNLRLSDQEKSIATHLYQGMQNLKQAIKSGISVAHAIAEVKAELARVADFKLEYLAVVDSHTMRSVGDLDDSLWISACAAAYVGEVRIIDNLYIKQEH